jgi:hypothetical protein
MELGVSDDPGLWAAKTEEMIGPLPADYDELAVCLEGATRGFRKGIAQILEPALNAKVTAMPQEGFDEKKALARWVNAELARFGLTLSYRVEDKQLPALLVAFAGRTPQSGRFSLHYRMPDGRRASALWAQCAPHLELMGAPPRREPLKWEERLKRQELQSDQAPEVRAP